MLTPVLLVLCAVLAGALGAAAVGMRIGGASMGYDLAAQIGCFFGLSTVVPAAIIAALVHCLAS